MKINFLENLKTIALIVALILVAYLLNFSCNKISEVSEIKRMSKEQIKDSVTYWKDKYGKEHAKIILNEVSLSTAKVFYEEKISRLTKELGVKDKQIKAALFVGKKTSGSVSGKIDTVYIPVDSSGSEVNDSNVTKPIDTIPVVYAQYRDKWVWIKTRVKNGYFNTQYEILDSITIAEYTKKKWFLGKETTYIDISSSNPNTKILNAQNYRLNKRDKRFGFGPFAGVIYDTQLRPVLGVGVFYNLFKF